VRAVSFDPDGKRLASGGLDKTVKIWDTEKWQEAASFQAHTNGVTNLCFSPDGKRIAVTSSELALKTDDAVKVWEVGKVSK
jgi:WD40 repeat protein